MERATSPTSPGRRRGGRSVSRCWHGPLRRCLFADEHARIQLHCRHPRPADAHSPQLDQSRWTLHAFRVESFESQRPNVYTSVAAQGDLLLPAFLPSGPATISVAFVSRDFFRTLGTQPIRGRLLDGIRSDQAASVAVVSEGLWRGAFNGDEGILGRALTIGGRAFTIVGVTPASAPGLRVVDLSSGEHAYPQVWLPLADAVYWKAADDRTRPWLTTAGRLSGTSSLASARAESALVARRLSALNGNPEADNALRRQASLQVFRGGLFLAGRSGGVPAGHRRVPARPARSARHRVRQRHQPATGSRYRSGQCS